MHIIAHGRVLCALVYFLPCCLPISTEKRSFHLKIKDKARGVPQRKLILIWKQIRYTALDLFRTELLTTR